MPTDDDPDLDALVGSLLTASRVLVGVSARSLADVEDRVTLSQFRTLVVLVTHGETPLNQLAERLQVGPSTALRAVDRLIAEGYAERAPGTADRRQVALGASPDGVRLVEEVTVRRRAAIADIVRRMPVTERSAVVSALDSFATAAGEPGERPRW